jgi:hypothetical protein
LHKNVAEEWDYSLNAPLKPEIFLPMSDKIVGWICKKCGGNGMRLLKVAVWVMVVLAVQSDINTQLKNGYLKQLKYMDKNSTIQKLSISTQKQKLRLNA